MIYPILIEFFIEEIVGCVMVIDMKNLFQGYMHLRRYHPTTICRKTCLVNVNFTQKDVLESIFSGFHRSLPY